MAVNNATGYNRTTNEPLDAIYLNSGSVYSSVAAANAAINIGVRYTGSFVNVQGNLYWYQNGVLDANLVPFIDTGSFNNSASFNAYTASVNTQLSNIYKSESNYTPTSSFQSYSASINAFTASVNTQLTNVYASQSNYMPVAGGTFTGPIVLSGDPTLSTQAATKNYVDQLINGLNWKHSVRAATTSSLATYSVDGTKTILTATSNGALIAQDAVSLIVADRLLVKNETGGNAPNNGIYQVTQTGSAAAPYILTRTTDANTSAELAGATAYVLSGSIEANRVYAINSSPITMGTTNIGFALVAGPSTYTNGSGITLTGNVFALDTAYTKGLLSVTSSTGITYNSSTGLFALSAIPNSSLANSTISGIALGSNLTNLTFNNSGTGATSGTTYNGGTAQTISYNTIGAQPLATNLTSLSGLTYVSLGFVKMSASGTFSLDTNTYLTSGTGVTTFSAGTTGLTPSSGTSGAITLSGTLIATNGGTGYTSLSSLAGDAAFTGKYLPLAGGTLTGALYLNHPSTSTANNIVYQTNSVNKWFLGTSVSAASDNFEIYNGNTSVSSIKINTTTDAVTLAGALNGTTGTFSGSGYFGGATGLYAAGSRGVVEVNGTSTAILALTTGGVKRGYLFSDGGSNIYLSSESSSNIVVQAAGTLALQTNGNNNALTINSSQQATFASSVTGGAASFTTGAFSSNITISNSGITNNSVQNGIVIYGSTNSNSVDASYLTLNQVWNGYIYPVGIGATYDNTYGAAAAGLSLYTSFYNGSGVSTIKSLYINPQGATTIGNGGPSTAELTIYGSGNSGRIVGYRNTLHLKNSQGSSNQSNAIVFGSNGTANSWTILNDITADGTNINRLDFMLNGSTIVLLNSGGLYTPGYVSADNGFVSSHAEGLRLENSSGYISGWNSANTTRTGYLQFNAGSNVTLAAEAGANNTMIFNTNAITALTINGSQNVILSASSGIGSIYTVGSYKTFNIDGNVGGTGGLLSLSYNGTCYGQIYTNSGLGLTLSSIGTGPISNYAYNYYVYTNSILALTINSSQQATFAGTVTATAGYNSSDRILKNEITRDLSTWRIADKITTIGYSWKDSNKGTGTRFGYYAQDLLPFIPEAVIKDNNGNYAVDYTMVHTVILDEHTLRIQQLEKEIEELKRKLAA